MLKSGKHLLERKKKNLHKEGGRVTLGAGGQKKKKETRTITESSEGVETQPK